MKLNGWPHLGLPVALLAGCGGESSSTDTDTSRLYAYYRVSANGDGTTLATANFSAVERYIDGFFPITNSIRLEGGDELSVSANGTTKTFSIDSSDGVIRYSTQFDFDAGPTEFVFRLNRPSRSETIESRVVLPADMAMLSPLEGADFSISSPIDVVWSPAAPFGRICVCFTAECYEQASAQTAACDCSIEDTGSYRASMPSLFADRGWDLVAQQSCTTKLSIERRSSGYPGGGLQGNIEARQVRSTTMVVNL